MTDQAANKTPVAKMVEVQWMEAGLATFANNLAFQFDGRSVYLTFAQVSPPLLVGKDQATIKDRFDKISSVTALPVARVVIPMDDFRNMLHILQTQLEKIDQLPKP